MPDLEAIKNIDFLPAGRELDALIAEKVMGWRRAVSVNGQPFYPPGLSPEGNILGHVIPAYSTDIAAAWDVVEKTGILDDYVLWQFGKQWAVGNPIPHSSGEWEVFAQGDTAPLAIVRAALKAVHA